MGHLLKIKCLDSRVNVHVLISTSIFTHDGAGAKFSTNSHETDNSVINTILLFLTLKILRVLSLHGGSLAFCKLSGGGMVRW